MLPSQPSGASRIASGIGGGGSGSGRRMFVNIMTNLFLLGLLGNVKSNQVRGYKTMVQSPIGLGSSPLPARPSAQIGTSRALHAGRALSSAVANRPLSPHLPIKKPQFSATFSISHPWF
ncbi:hypothetical protein LUZ63_012283 [Rhynchospora breviuscula]|uniref:Uncharacterized protein n=1 Tax=Rhynchospora breviuscula TaxID=2022672 RepID=A0A9Q0CKT2_9POAL|nr:hypothetical protein LUZ63_012283 [Rhynchospora breviuscula]